MSERPLASARGVCVDLSGRRILTDVDLDVEPGSFVGILGPNGAGKTTLLRALLGLVPCSAGQVRIDGLKPRSAWRTVGYVPQRQGFAWDYPISVEQVVMSGLVRHQGMLRQARTHHWKAVHHALDRVVMDDHRHRTIGELSGGQRQRVLIARALATGCRLLVLDEPFTGVDLPTQEALTRLLADLASEGTAVVMTSHDLASTMAACHRVVLVNRGIVADGTPEDLRDASLWERTFRVGPDSPVLAALNLRTPQEVLC